MQTICFENKSRCNIQYEIFCKKLYFPFANVLQPILQCSNNNNGQTTMSSELVNPSKSAATSWSDIATIAMVNKA